MEKLSILKSCLPKLFKFVGHHNSSFLEIHGLQFLYGKLNFCSKSTDLIQLNVMESRFDLI